MLCSLTLRAVTVGLRRRHYGEGLLLEPPSATHAVYTSNLATLLDLPILRDRARFQQPKRRVGSEATRRRQALFARIQYPLCHTVRLSIPQVHVPAVAAATAPVGRTAVMDVQLTTTASRRLQA